MVESRAHRLPFREFLTNEFELYIVCHFGAYDYPVYAFKQHPPIHSIFRCMAAKCINTMSIASIGILIFLWVRSVCVNWIGGGETIERRFLQKCLPFSANLVILLSFDKILPSMLFTIIPYLLSGEAHWKSFCWLSFKDNASSYKGLLEFL